MNQELSTSEQKLRAIMQHAPLGLIEIEESGIIVNINLMAGKLLKPIGQIDLTIGDNLLPILSHIHPEIAAQILSFQAAGGLIMLHQHYSFQVSPGVVKHYKFTITKMFEGCIMVSLEDMTEKFLEDLSLKQAQQDKAVAQGKYEIASEVLHDIGNAVIGFGSYLTRVSRMLEQGNLNNLNNIVKFLKQQHQAIESAIGAPKTSALITMLEAIYKAEEENHQELQQSVTQQLNIISHIQDILNIQRQYVSGHESQERKPVNLKDIINDCWAMVAVSMERKNIALSLIVPPKPVEIKGDRTKLMQVVLNILKNSIEAIDIDGAQNKIAIELKDSDHILKLIISDTGKGFDSEAGKQLFDRGYTTKDTGTGLGLYNCKLIIESHNGNIEMKSEGIDKGSRTTIELHKEI